MNVKNLLIALIIVVLVGVVGFFITQMSTTDTATNDTPKNEQAMPVEPDSGIGDGAEPTDEMMMEERSEETVIGTSVEGKTITAYHFGTGADEVVLIGGVHGGYSWNTALLGYELIDYFDANPAVIPENITVTVIPVMNPDGLESTVGTVGRFSSTIAAGLNEDVRIAGRFNAENVDLNRNFDCEWKPTSNWQNRTVSGGDAAFSEPEAMAIRDYVTKAKPVAAIVWFSSEGKVYLSACGSRPSTASGELANTFGTAAKYPVSEEFNAYAISGDMVNWMAKQGIPAISVLLTDHTDTEFNKNKAGVEAVLKAYAN